MQVSPGSVQCQKYPAEGSSVMASQFSVDWRSATVRCSCPEPSSALIFFSRSLLDAGIWAIGIPGTDSPEPAHPSLWEGCQVILQPPPSENIPQIMRQGSMGWCVGFLGVFSHVRAHTNFPEFECSGALLNVLMEYSKGKMLLVRKYTNKV